MGFQVENARFGLWRTLSSLVNWKVAQTHNRNARGHVHFLRAKSEHSWHVSVDAQCDFSRAYP